MRRLFLFLLIVSGTTAHGQFSSYRMAADLDSVRQNGWHHLHILPSWLAQMREDKADVRLFSFRKNDTLETPYLVRKSEDRMRTKEIPVHIINRGISGRTLFLTLSQPSKKIINTLTFSPEAINFNCGVTIEGSDDQKNWIRLATDEPQRIFGIQNSDISYRYTTLRFTETNFRYLRLQLSDASQLGTVHVEATENTVDWAELDTLRIISTTTTENHTDHTTEMIAEFENPSSVDRLQLRFSNTEDFYRSVDVLARGDSIGGRNGNNAWWYPVSSGVVSSLEPAILRNLSVRASAIKLVIHNHNDQPLKIANAIALAERTYLAAKLEKHTRYVLTFGKKNDQAPRYDVVYFQETIPSVLQIISAGVSYSLQSANNVTTFGQNWWIWVLLIIAAVILGWMAMGLIKEK